MSYHFDRNDHFAAPPAEFARQRDYIILPPRKERLSIDLIQRLVADHFSITVREMVGPCKGRFFARPRQVAMYLSRRYAHRSFPEIGRRFGGRDHSTVIHAMATVERLRRDVPEFDLAVSEVEALL